jgi:UDP-2,3-diacylglucosamine pyrophosphatase LpxH
VYITGNHDELMRKYSNLSLGNFQITDKLVMEINGSMCWIFHGDVFDATTKGSAKILAKLGGKGYDLLILMNSCINWGLKRMGRDKMSFSKKVKNSVKKAVSWINNFEQTAAELAIDKKYDYVICGHIHQPQKRIVQNEKGQVVYLNSGDWIENLTALEYNNNDWQLYQYDEKQTTIQEFVKRPKPKLDVVSEEVMLYIQSLMLDSTVVHP